MVKGTVSISIDDLSYLHAQIDLTPHIDSFNRQSTKSQIVIESDNKIKIKFNEE